MFPVGMGDVNPASAKGKESGNAEESLNTWRIHLEDTMREYAATGSSVMLQIGEQLSNLETRIQRRNRN